MACGYEVFDEEPPDICPVCGAPKDMFEEVTDEDN
jgi:rubrerythrin